MKKKILFVMLVCAMLYTAAITGLMSSGTSYAEMKRNNQGSLTENGI